jgi:hypothetical protein
MQSSAQFNDHVNLEIFNVSTMVAVSPILTLDVERLEDITPQQLYQEGMENIWDKVNQLPEGQDKVTLSQLWEFGKTSPLSTSKNFPALAMYGFIVEQLVDGQRVWKASSPYLKDFWRVGIHVSNASGFTLQPRQAFEASLQAKMYMIFNDHHR